MNKKISLENTLPIYQRFLPIIKNVSTSPCINLWDIPYTIKQMSYLVHSHYRYYGKFPPAVAGQIFEQCPPPSKDHYVIDNFSGSGTTLVEAKLRGIKSYGIDISWISTLVSNVKTRHINIDEVKQALNALIALFESEKKHDSFIMDDFVSKWFNDDAISDLYLMQQFILDLPESEVRDFLLVAFIGIVRRVSKAHDGEVRPHINKTKKQRNVLDAFTKKVLDMCKDQTEFMDLTSSDVISKCYHGDNLCLPEKFKDGKCYLAISHPPYLNSFNYAPVYSLEFYWSKPFEPYYTLNENLHKTELKAHPANEKITKEYFNHLKQGYTEIYKIQDKGSYLAVVIGDCTRKGKVIPVIDNIIRIVEEIGYSLVEVNYRTTHYGLGKYAYNHRADYHGNSEKKDGIILFKK